VTQGRRGRAKIGQELIIPGLALGFTGYYFWTVSELAWEAKANGIVIGSILIGLVAILAVQIGARVARGDASLGVTLGGEPATNRVRLGLLGIVAAFLLLLTTLGTTLALGLMLFAAMWLLGARHWPTLVGVSVLTPLLVWVSLMLALGTRFPVGPFERTMAAWFGLGAFD